MQRFFNIVFPLGFMFLGFFLSIYNWKSIKKNSNIAYILSIFFLFFKETVEDANCFVLCIRFFFGISSYIDIFRKWNCSILYYWEHVQQHCTHGCKLRDMTKTENIGSFIGFPAERVTLQESSIYRCQKGLIQLCSYM